MSFSWRGDALIFYSICLSLLDSTVKFVPMIVLRPSTTLMVEVSSAVLRHRSGRSGSEGLLLLLIPEGRPIVVVEKYSTV